MCSRVHMCACHYALMLKGEQLKSLFVHLVSNGASSLPQMCAGLPCLSLPLPCGALELQIHSPLHVALVWVQGTQTLVWQVRFTRQAISLAITISFYLCRLIILGFLHSN